MAFPVRPNQPGEPTGLLRQLVKQMSTVAENPEDRDDLSELMSKVMRAKDYNELSGLPDVVRLGSRSGSKVFVVRTGSMHALVTVDENDPQRLVIVSICRALISGADIPSRETSTLM